MYFMKLVDSFLQASIFIINFNKLMLRTPNSYNKWIFL